MNISRYLVLLLLVLTVAAEVMSQPPTIKESRRNTTHLQQQKNTQNAQVNASQETADQKNSKSAQHIQSASNDSQINKPANQQEQKSVPKKKETKSDASHMVDKAVEQLDDKNITNITGIIHPFNKHPENKLQRDWFIIFYSPRCPHCKKTLPIWNEFAREVNDLGTGKPYTVASVDCLAFWDLCEGFNIEGFPTMLYVDKDHQTYEFESDRTKQNFRKFADSSFQAKKIFKYRSSKDMTWPERVSRMWKNLTPTGVVLLFVIVLLIGLLIYVILDKDLENYKLPQGDKYNEEDRIGLPEEDL